MKKAVCPGSFDPVTNGHIDIIKRAAELFDEVTVLVVTNPDKKCVFSPEERCDLIRKSTENIEGIKVDSFSGLLADYVKKNGINAIVKGIRSSSDFEYEFQMALANRSLAPDAETVFITASAAEGTVVEQRAFAEVMQVIFHQQITLDLGVHQRLRHIALPDKRILIAAVTDTAAHRQRTGISSGGQNRQ